ncbi:MAG TPA: DUF3037 domain-containing protein [Terriglobales bacterium]|jgi:hypothetical protein
MAEKKQYEFFLLRYVPDAVRDDSVTIGIVMYEPGNRSGFSEVRLTEDWRRLRCFDPEVNVEELQALGSEVQRELRGLDREMFLKRMGESFSNLVQVSPVKALLAEDAAKELNALTQIYLETRNAPMMKRALTGRQWIVGQMSDAFAQAGVLAQMQQKFAVAPFTQEGDPMKLDFAYPIGKQIKFLHAVSFSATSWRTSVDQAVILASRFPEIAAGISEKQNGRAMLTAVVDDDLDRKNNEIGFALAMMQGKGLRIAPIAEMPRIAQEIRVELRV